jgi:hypothetical protein
MFAEFDKWKARARLALFERIMSVLYLLLLPTHDDQVSARRLDGLTPTQQPVREGIGAGVR